MASPRYATVDVGTNAVLLLVAERQPDGGFVPIREEMEITRLGRGVDRTGLLAEEAIAETVAVVGRFAAIAREAGAVDLAVTATSAVRDARNGRSFLDAASVAAGAEVELVGGELEAELTWESARRDFGARDRPLAVVDIGGGSTELIFGQGERIDWRRSFDVGAVRLTERWIRSDPPTPAELDDLRRDLAAHLAQVPPPPPGSELVGVAGTVTTLVAIRLGMEVWDGARVHGHRMAASEVRRLADRLASLDLATRKRLPGLPPKRADVIVAGAEILAGVLDRLGLDAVVASDRGVRWGMLYRRFGG